MPRIANVRERRHQPFWDTLIRTTGNPTVPLQNSTNLFGNSNVGNLALTNLQVAGQLASEQTYVILALRASLYFNGTNRRANYLRVNSQLYWTLIVGEKPMFQAPCWYFPAGGGVWGFDATPATATNYQRWRPISTYPLPDQVVDTDIIDILYELQDGGSQRNFQNAPRGPLLSRPDNVIPCAVPTLWSPNAAIAFYPTYNKLTWDSTTPPTQGTLHVDLIGYRVVNL